MGYCIVTALSHGTLLLAALANQHSFVPTVDPPHTYKFQFDYGVYMKNIYLLH